MRRLDITLAILLLAAPAVFAKERSTATFDGTVVIRSSGPRQMVVLLDSYGRGDGRDGIVDHAWVIAAQEPYATPLSLRLDGARVTSEPGRITVFSAAEHVAVVFLVDGTSDDDSWRPSGTTVHRFSGYGLSAYRGDMNLPRLAYGSGPGANPYLAQERDPWGDGGY